VVHNATTWVDTSTGTQPAVQGGVNIYINLYTSDGDASATLGSRLFGVGYVRCLLTTIRITMAVTITSTTSSSSSRGRSICVSSTRATATRLLPWAWDSWA